MKYGLRRDFSGGFPVQTLLGDWPGSGTQLRYEASGDLLVEHYKKQ